MKKILLVFLALLPVFSFAQQLIANRNVVSNGYNFWIYTPKDYDSSRHEKPLVIFLHGNSLCGNDLSRVRRYGCLDALDMGRTIDAVVLAPQNPGGSWNPQKILNVMNWTTTNYAVDTNRVYVVGMSLGGYGTINFVGTYPEKIAAAMALCGGGTLKSYCGLNQVPLWILHGTADRAVACSQSQNVVNAMKDCGDTSLLRFTKLKGMNHSQLAKAFYINETYQWLFAHSKADSVKTVDKTVIINHATLDAAYQNVHRGANKITVIDPQIQKNDADTTQTSTPDQTAASKTPETKYHTVKQGDTLYAIAKKYHTTVDKLCKLNKMKESTILKLGRKLRVK